MTTINDVERGIANYLDEELIPKLPENGFQKVLAGAAVSILIRRAGSSIETIKDHPVVKMMGILEEQQDGTILVDLDIIRDELKNQLTNNPNGINVDVPVIGTMTFHASDIDRIYEHIRRVSNQGSGYTINTGQVPS